jgi:hypothetical protein
LTLTLGRGKFFAFSTMDETSNFKSLYLFIPYSPFATEWNKMLIRLVIELPEKPQKSASSNGQPQPHFGVFGLWPRRNHVLANRQNTSAFTSFISRHFYPS